jgi:hypothetical protein
MARIDLNAWREIIARIFEGFEVKYNVSPDWLINPATNRRLKLDLLYPQIGVALKFEGLQPPQRRRRESLEEEEQRKIRETARDEVCEAHGITLASLNLSTPEHTTVFTILEPALSRATRRLAKDNTRPSAQKAYLLEQLREARSRLNQFKGQIKTDRDLNPYTELWQDRQFLAAQPESTPVPIEPPPLLSEGMRVEHTHFGSGLVKSVTSSGEDNLVTINFDKGGQRTFMLNLLADKLTVKRHK